jgi:hypothetical protein
MKEFILLKSAVEKVIQKLKTFLRNTAYNIRPKNTF